MEKRISVTNFRAIKRIAQAVNPLVIKKNKLQEQVNELTGELESYKAQIKGMEQGVIAMTGLQSEDLVKKVVEPTGKFDKEGKPIKNTKYVPTDIVTKDEERNEYVITLPDPEAPSEKAQEEAPAEVPANDEPAGFVPEPDTF